MHRSIIQETISATSPQKSKHMPPIRLESIPDPNAKTNLSITESLRHDEDAPLLSDQVVGALPSPAAIERKISSETLLKNTNSFIVNSEKVASFISQLKEGDISTRRASGFRIRRLTYAQKTAEAPEAPSPLTTKRTTIYSSKEIGVRQEKDPPFPPMVLGTFSCHGIEPAHVDEDASGVVDEDGDYIEEIVEKTNQDRGCVVHPFNHSYKESLFLVLDGHGEQGDRVSEFCMRSVSNFLFVVMSFHLTFTVNLL